MVLRGITFFLDFNPTVSNDLMDIKFGTCDSSLDDNVCEGVGN